MTDTIPPVHASPGEQELAAGAGVFPSGRPAGQGPKGKAPEARPAQRYGMLDRSVDRAAVATDLRAQGVGCGHGMWVTHLQPVFGAKRQCPVSADLFQRNLAIPIPMHAELNLNQVERVAEALRTALRASSASTRALGGAL